MSVCGVVLMPSGHCTQVDINVQELSPLEREFSHLDESRSWNLFYEACLLQLNPKTDGKIDTEILSPVSWGLDLTFLDDETRVLLQSESTGDYINANYVKVNEVPSRRYILTQGPLPQTVGHFWQMVLEQKSRVIIMLNRFTEKGTLKCFNYFPLNSQQTLTFPESTFSVTCISEENKGLYAIRTLEAVNSDTNEAHRIQHFHYTRWPDFGVPDYSGSMLNLLWDVRRTGALDDPDRPAIIHCSAGVGRSGTFILIDLALTMIEKQNSMEGVNLPSLLIQLRQCRMGIIQTAQQLRYSYAAVVEGGRLLLATPPEERLDLVFPEHDRHAADTDDDDIGSDSTTSEDISSDSDDSSADSDVINEIVDFPSEVHLPQNFNNEPELLRHLWMRSGGDCVMEDDFSSSGSSNEENEIEIMELFDRRKSYHQNHAFQSPCPPVKFEEVLDNGDVIKETVVMSQSSEPSEQQPSNNNNTSNNNNNDGQQPPNENVQKEGGQGEDIQEKHSNEEEKEQGNDEQSDSQEEGEEEELSPEELKIKEEEALELIRERHEARLARQERTRAKIAELTQRMAEKDMLRKRWLPPIVAEPLRTFYTGYGLFNNLTEAALFTMGLVSLFVAVTVGLWYHHTS
nr:tyrosine protein phosphatase non receptor type [Hymenolepis microstoma]